MEHPSSPVPFINPPIFHQSYACSLLLAIAPASLIHCPILKDYFDFACFTLVHSSFAQLPSLFLEPFLQHLEVVCLWQPFIFILWLPSFLLPPSISEKAEHSLLLVPHQSSVANRTHRIHTLVFISCAVEGRLGGSPVAPSPPAHTERELMCGARPVQTFVPSGSTCLIGSAAREETPALRDQRLVLALQVCHQSCEVLLKGIFLLLAHLDVVNEKPRIRLVRRRGGVRCHRGAGPELEGRHSRESAVGSPSALHLRGVGDFGVERVVRAILIEGRF